MLKWFKFFVINLCGSSEIITKSSLSIARASHVSSSSSLVIVPVRASIGVLRKIALSLAVSDHSWNRCPLQTKGMKKFLFFYTSYMLPYGERLMFDSVGKSINNWKYSKILNFIVLLRFAICFYSFSNIYALNLFFF